MNSNMMTSKTMGVALLIVAAGAITACQKQPEADTSGTAAQSNMSSTPLDGGNSSPDTPGLTPPPGESSSSSSSSVSSMSSSSTPPTGASSPTSLIEHAPDNRPVTRLASAYA